MFDRSVDSAAICPDLVERVAVDRDAVVTGRARVEEAPAFERAGSRDQLGGEDAVDDNVVPRGRASLDPRLCRGDEGDCCFRHTRRGQRAQLRPRVHQGTRAGMRRALAVSVQGA